MCIRDSPDADKANETFNLPRFASLQNNNRVGANSRTGFYLKKYNAVSYTHLDVYKRQIDTLCIKRSSLVCKIRLIVF